MLFRSKNQVSVSLCWVCSFPHRDVPVGAKNIPHRLRFTRALLESKDLSMRFSLPLCVWVSGIGPCSVETASEKRSPRTSYPPGWEAEFAGGGISKLPSARRDSQPACVWKPIFARNGLVSPEASLLGLQMATYSLCLHLVFLCYCCPNLALLKRISIRVD